MTFQESIVTCYRKYGTFSGRATRSEFWWFMLFTQIVVGIPLAALSSTLDSLWTFANMIPLLAVSARRLHDTDRSGWWQLVPIAPLPLVIMPLIGVGFADDFSQSPFFWAGILLTLGLYVLLIVWYATSGTPGRNRFGDDPMNRTDADIFS